MHIPLFLDVQDWSVLIVGGGKIALRKARELSDAGASINLLAPQRCPGWEDIKVQWLKDEFSDQMLVNYNLVIAATDDATLNKNITELAKKKGILCNCASAGKTGDVIFPGVVRENGITVAISTQGETPFITKRLKTEALKITQSYSRETIELLGAIRREIIANYPEKKEELLEKLSSVPIEILQEKGNIHEITDWLQGE